MLGGCRSNGAKKIWSLDFCVVLCFLGVILRASVRSGTGVRSGAAAASSPSVASSPGASSARCVASRRKTVSETVHTSGHG